MKGPLSLPLWPLVLQVVGFQTTLEFFFYLEIVQQPVKFTEPCNMLEED